MITFIESRDYIHTMHVYSDSTYKGTIVPLSIDPPKYKYIDCSGYSGNLGPYDTLEQAKAALMVLL